MTPEEVVKILLDEAERKSRMGDIVQWQTLVNAAELFGHDPDGPPCTTPISDPRWQDPLPLVVRVVDKKRSGESWESHSPPWFQVWIHPEGWSADVKIAVAVSKSQYDALDVGTTFKLYRDAP